MFFILFLIMFSVRLYNLPQQTTNFLADDLTFGGEDMGEMFFTYSFNNDFAQ
jgi:hypothetical protein